MLMNVNPFSRNSPTRDVPNRNSPRMTLFFARLAHQLVRCRSQLRRRVHVRELVLLVQAHRHAQVVLAQEQDVDARNRGDLGHVLDAGGGLHLQRDDDVRVRVADVAQQPRLVRAALRKVDRARTCGRVTGTAHGLPRLFGRVDVGHQHAVGAQVQRLLDARRGRDNRPRAPSTSRRRWRSPPASPTNARSSSGRAACPPAASRSRCAQAVRPGWGCAHSERAPSSVCRREARS